jgi:hypothetical protein
MTVGQTSSFALFREALYFAPITSSVTHLCLSLLGTTYELSVLQCGMEIGCTATHPGDLSVPTHTWIYHRALLAAC